MSSHPFDTLSPDFILDAVEAAGLRVDGRLLALNSFENRVYQVGVEEATPVVAKFYRPHRWSAAQILEEHAFTLALAQQEVPAIAPLVLGGESLHRCGDFLFAVYPRQGGHPLPVDDMEALRSVGRQLGRLHTLGECEPFSYRQTLGVGMVEPEAWELMLEHFVPPDMARDFDAVGRALLAQIGDRLAGGWLDLIRLHGDCHAGNVLWRDGTAFFVDFDDSRMGPAVQDLWLFLSGEQEERAVQLRALLSGYEEFREFDDRELKLVEPLRSLRMLHYLTWLAQRWDDPAFPPAFPWFGGRGFWTGQLTALRDQLRLLEMPT